jgi:hypothetical protein
MTNRGPGGFPAIQNGDATMDEDEIIETEFELNELVFVPAGDGAAAQWMRKGDLHVGEFDRHVQHLKATADLQMERTTRYCELLREARKLEDGELAELAALKLILDAQEREQDRRQPAIDRDIAAGRYLALRRKAAESDDDAA